MPPVRVCACRPRQYADPWQFERGVAQPKSASRRAPNSTQRHTLGLVRRARRMNRTLSQAFPHVYCELDFTNPLELTVATILSAQSTDKRVNLTTPALFVKYRTALDYARPTATELEEIIRPTGFYRNKAKSLMGSARSWSSGSTARFPTRSTNW